MFAAYFEKRKSNAKAIKERQNQVKSVINALKLVENEALDALTPLTIPKEHVSAELEELRRENLDFDFENTSKDWLAVRLQREKMQQIYEYLSSYLDCYINEGTNLPDPAVDLKGYIEELVEKIVKNKDVDISITNRQLFLSSLISLISFALVLVSLTILIHTTGGFVMMPISIISLILFMTIACAIQKSKIVEQDRINLIENDCVPTITRPIIRFGPMNDASILNRVGILMSNKADGKIMCSNLEVRFEREPPFEIVTTITNLDEWIKIPSSCYNLPKNYETTIWDAFNNRPFSRKLYFKNHDLNDKIEVIHEDKTALKERFFKSNSTSKYSAIAVQSTLTSQKTN